MYNKYIDSVMMSYQLFFSNYYCMCYNKYFTPHVIVFYI